MKTPFGSPDFFQAFSDKRSWEPGWMADFRKDSWNRFAALPQTKIKDEKWRFSPRARFGYSNCDQLTDSPKSTTLEGKSSEQVIFESFDQAILDHPNLLSILPSLTGPKLGSDATFLLGSSFSESGFIFKAKKNYKEEEPFICKHFAPKQNHSLFQQNIVIIEPFAEVTLIEYFDSEDQSSTGVLSNLSHIQLGEGAKLNRVVVQRLNSHSTFNHLEKVELGRNAQFTNVSLQLGSAQTRVESRGDIIGCLLYTSPSPRDRG